VQRGWPKWPCCMPSERVRNFCAIAPRFSISASYFQRGASSFADRAKEREAGCGQQEMKTKILGRSLGAPCRVPPPTYLVGYLYVGSPATSLCKRLAGSADRFYRRDTRFRRARHTVRVWDYSRLYIYTAGHESLLAVDKRHITNYCPGTSQFASASDVSAVHV
jgi:hypothetical protein